MLGIRLGGIGIGFAAGLGVLLLGLLGLNTNYAHNIPFGVIAIIMAVIGAIATMQVAGGLDFLVKWVDRILRKHPRQLVIWAPIVTFLMTIFAGTGNTAFSALPVIVEVARENNLRPTRALSIAVVSSQLAICASPVSAAVVWMTTADSFSRNGALLGTQPIHYLDLLAVMIPACFRAVLVVALVMNILPDKPLDQVPEYQRRLAAGEIVAHGHDEIKVKKEGKASVGIFIGAIILVMLMAITISPKVGWLHTGLGRSVANSAISYSAADGIIAIMLATAVVIMMVCRVKPDDVLGASTFRAGINSIMCVLGVAWLGTTYVNGHMDIIQKYAGNALSSHAWLFAVIVFIAAALLYSQASTSRAIMPVAFTLNLSQTSVVAAFPAVSALFVLPTYPTLVAAVQMDYTGSTQIGRYIFNHPFFVPGVACIVLAVIFGYLLGAIIL